MFLLTWTSLPLSVAEVAALLVSLDSLSLIEDGNLKSTLFDKFVLILALRTTVCYTHQKKHMD